MRRSTRGIDYQDVPRPVAVLVDEYAAGFVDPSHSHRRAQLIYASAGIMTVITAAASFVVPPQRAVWMPGGVAHEVRCRTAVSVRTLYVDASVRADLPATCRVIDVSDLLRALIQSAMSLPVEYALAGREARIMTLILDEIAASAAIPLDVPMPQNDRLLRVCRSILAEPGHTDTLDDWARAAAMGRRTLTRMFRRETGMSFAAWRQHVRLMEALSLLATGHPVTSIAYAVGYASPSAFTAMFRRAFGAAPTQYVREDAQRRKIE